GRAFERVGDATPDGVMGRVAVGLVRFLVPVDLVEVVDVLVLPVLKDVEAQAARLVALRPERVDLDGVEEPLPLVRLDSHLYPTDEHVHLLWLAPSLIHSVRSGRRRRLD